MTSDDNIDTRYNIIISRTTETDRQTDGQTDNWREMTWRLQCMP